MKSNIPLGFKLRHRLQGHSKEINRIAWSPDGRILASASDDGTIRLWDVETGELHSVLSERAEPKNFYYNVTWSGDGKFIASGSQSGVQIWDVASETPILTYNGHTKRVIALAWSRTGTSIASASDDRSMHIWNVTTGESLEGPHLELEEEAKDIIWDLDNASIFVVTGKCVYCCNSEGLMRWKYNATATDDGCRALALSPDGKIMAVSVDHSIQFLNLYGQVSSQIEGHTGPITSLSFSSDGSVLASRSLDETVRIWKVESLELITTIRDICPEDASFAGVAFHPHMSLLATLAEYDKAIHVWDLDLTTFLSNISTTRSVYYTNAKVVLVGDSGVGKTGLGYVLTRQPFVPSESTHGRHVWTFQIEKAKNKGTRETLLWDLAGQPGYRLIHQLHLNEVTIALLVFDASREDNLFTGVRYWVRALRMAEFAQGRVAPQMHKFLVAARVDRGGRNVSRNYMDLLIQELGLDGYFETSAKEGKNITALAETIKNAIDWDALPRVRSTKLFHRIKTFLMAEKEAGRFLSTHDDLYRAYLRSARSLKETDDLPSQFEACISLVESKGLIRRLRFGNLVLLQPELLDVYASALVNAVTSEPHGLGCILEEDVQMSNFLIPSSERIMDSYQEKLLLIAMIEDLLHHEIALREQGEEGAYLVFPSQSTREMPELPDPEGKEIVFTFDGPVLNIYATLVVRLSHCGLFLKENIWKHAVTYTTKTGGTYGILMGTVDEGSGELTLFFDKTTSEQNCFHFEEYVHTHLRRRTLPESIKRRRIFACNECGSILTDQIVQLRLKRGLNWLVCPVCDQHISLLDRKERLRAAPSSRISEMDRAADKQRLRATARSVVQGKKTTKDFDVFLCHHGGDKSAVKRIGELLKERGILPWLDEWELQPGLPWQRLLEEQIGLVKSAAVFVGRDGIGPWEHIELEAFLRQFIRRKCPVIPVILANAPNKELQVPIFLEGMTWVDFRRDDLNPIEQLIWGITGKRVNS